MNLFISRNQFISIILFSIIMVFTIFSIESYAYNQKPDAQYFKEHYGINYKTIKDGEYYAILFPDKTVVINNKGEVRVYDPKEINLENAKEIEWKE